MEIYQEIKRIFDLSNPRIIASWNMEETQVPLFQTDDYEGGLIVRVHAPNFSGDLQIVLSWLDLFDVTLLNEDGSVRHLVCNIYADALVPIINELLSNPVLL